MVGEVNEIRAVPSETSSSGISTGLLVAIGAMVVAALAGLGFFLTRRNRGQEEDTQPTAEPAGV